MPRTRTLLALLVCSSIGLYVGGCSPGTSCRVSNCGGCCDANGQCQTVADVTACGLGAVACQTCQPQVQGCFDGLCQNLLPDGGHAAGGGSNGGGTGTGGGSGTGGGGAVGMCGGMACNGCCDSNNACAGGNTIQKCGIGGAACVMCPNGQTCKNNACAPFACPTCTDSNHVCQAGNQNANCGSDGGTCAICGSGQQCISGSCVVPSSCSATNCQLGCCEGTVCNMPTTDMKCGSGGAACVACTGGQTCQQGACQTSGTGGGSGATGGGSGATGGGSGGMDCLSFTCNGCCDSNLACQPGDQKTECGSGNLPCSDCTNDGITGTCFQLSANSYVCL